MAAKLGDALVYLGVDDKALDKGLNAARGKVSGWLSNIAQGIAQGVGQALFGVFAGGVRAAVGEIGKATRAASDLNETVSKTTTVFGESSKEVLEWSKTTDKAFGLSQQSALEATSTLGNMFIQMGEGQQQAAGMSSLMVELAADIASFNNVGGGAEEVLDNMSSAFRGEYDPIQKYLPLINAAAVEQQALAETGKSAAKELTALEKAVATQTLIMNGAGAAAGDFARTIGGVANQERILAAQLENARASLGQAFTPIYGEILRGLNLLVKEVSGYGDGIVRALAEGMVDGIIWLLPVIAQIRDVFTYWMQPHSPPRMLPDLAKWGKATLEVYLRSMATADFGILRELGGSIENILRSFVGTGAIKETDIVSLVFGSQKAIAGAVGEWRKGGSITADSIRAIQDAAGPAGSAIGGLVQSYFDLQGASEQAARAQEELTSVTERYERALSPLQDQLDELQGKQQALRDAQDIKGLQRTIRDPRVSASERRLAALEIEEIRLRQQMGTIEDERDAAVDAAEEKLRAAQKQETSAQAAFDLQQAQLQQQLELNKLIAEQVKQADRLYQATLAYNLATADTAGKLALMRLELGRTEEGSVEYFNILTQIAGLEEQLAKGAAGGLLPPVLPPIEGLDVPTWASDLATKLRREIDAALGDEPLIQGPAEDPGPFGISIAKGSPVTDHIVTPAINQQVKDFVEALDELTEALLGVTPPLQGLAGLLGVGVPAAAAAGTAGVTSAVNTNLAQTTASMKGWTALTTGDWQAFWDAFREYSVLTTNDTSDDFLVMVGDMIAGSDEWFAAWMADIAAETAASKIWWDAKKLEWSTNLTNIWTTISTFDLSSAGTALLRNFGSGLTSYWDSTLQPWWTGAMQWIADLLPGSEPKNPASPLRGLGDAGSALLNNIWDGAKLAWIGFSGWWMEKMQWIADQIPDLPSWLGGDSTAPSSGDPAATSSSFPMAATSMTPALAAKMPSGGNNNSRHVEFHSGAIAPVFYGVTGAEDAQSKFEEWMTSYLENAFPETAG